MWRDILTSLLFAEGWGEMLMVILLFLLVGIILVILFFGFVVFPLWALYLSARGVGQAAQRATTALRDYGAKRQREREDAQRDDRTLLHPSSAPANEPETLLRAAWEQTEREPETLLRASQEKSA